MALKDTWVDRVNGVDEVSAEDPNEIAHAVIDLENNMGDIDSALDGIISIQNTLVGGQTE